MGKGVEEVRRRIGKRVAAERSDRDSRDAVRAGPNGGQRNEEDVAAWQVGVLVGFIGGGDARTGDAPMVAVEIGSWGREDGCPFYVWVVERVDEQSKKGKFRIFPPETALHIDGVDFGVIRQLCDQDRGVQTAACQY